jgi:WD40 repeat protein
MKINNNLNEKKIKSNNSKIKNSVQAKKDVSKKNKVKNIDNEKMNKNQNSKIKNKINENKEKTNLNNYDKVKNISRKNGNKNNENNKRLLDNTDEENEKKRQKKNSTVYMKQSPKILNQSLNDNKKILKKNYIGQNNNDCNVKNDILKTNNESIRKIQEKENDFKPKNVNTIKLESKNIKEASNTTNKQSKLHSNSNKSEINTNSNNNINIKNYNNNSMNDSLKIKTIIDLKEKHDLSITNPLNSVVLSKENNSNNNSQIKIKYNTKSKKNTKNDNNKVISTSYNFVRFENVTLSKYCYQYHFLYKYRCNKCCESITWGGYNDCDDYKQYKLYIDNSDYSLSVLTTDLYSINNPAIIRQMAYDEVVNYNNINYIGDVEYERSINHNLIYSQQLNILLSNIDNQHYYIWNLKNNKYQTYNYDKNSIHDLKEPSLKLQYNGILHDSITLSGSGVFGLDSDGNLAKWNLDTIPSMNESDKMSICSINPQSIIKLQNNEKIKKIKTYSNNNQEILIALSTNNNIMFYDLKNDDFKPINNFKKAHNSNITTIDINPINSFYVLTGGDDNFIKIWDLRNPSAELISSCYYSNGINKLRWCPHLSNTFCCSSKNGIISIWSMNSLSENKPLMINNEHQSNRPVKVDFEWNPHKEQEGTIASVDKPGINNIRDSCVQVWRPLVYTYLYNGLIK